MSTSRGYSSYRGRMPFWKVLVMAVLIVIILASAGVVLLQRLLVYDDRGIPHVQLSEREGPEDVPPLDVDGEEGGADGTEHAEESGGTESAEGAQASTESTTDAAPVPVSARNTLRGYNIQARPLTASIASDAKAILRQGGYDAVAVTLKDEAGRLYFNAPSAAELDNDQGAAADTTEALRALTGYTLPGASAPIRSIARIACFHDSWRSNMNVERYGLKNTGTYIFYDGNSTNWMDPAKPAARAYLCGLAKDAAALGFREILLTAVGYPTVGKLDKIAYGDTPIGQNLTTFLSEMRTELAAYGVTLSIEMPKAILIGDGDPSGMTLRVATPYVDRIYAPVDAGEIEACQTAVNTAASDAGRAGAVTFVPELRETLPSPAPARYLFTA